MTKPGHSNHQVVDTIKEAYDFMCREGLITLDISRTDYKLILKRRDKKKEISQTIVHQHSDSTKKLIENKDKDFVAIKSPLIGVFYRAPSPNRKPFVEVGQVVDKGQTLCIIEAMKVMNEVLAPYRCKIEKIEVENGTSMIVDQTILLVTPVK